MPQPQPAKPTANHELTTAVLGLPRIGPHRELKAALESYWDRQIPAGELQRVASDLRHQHLRRAAAIGIDSLPSNDFSLYDHVLDTCVLVGAVPERFAAYPNQVGPGVYDVHSPRVPSVSEIEALLASAERQIPRERLWVNPDCGLKTRAWDEVLPSLEHLAAAAKRRRVTPHAVVDLS
ncbi:MAG TPA: hypothetical protein VIJ39_08670 [Solirubrobacteraceae bacterium]